MRITGGCHCGHITYEADEGIATCTLSRPEQLNAYTPRMGIELRESLAGLYGGRGGFWEDNRGYQWWAGI